MKPEMKMIVKPIPEGLDCGDRFTELEMARIRELREILKSREWNCVVLWSFIIEDQLH